MNSSLYRAIQRNVYGSTRTAEYSRGEEYDCVDIEAEKNYCSNVIYKDVELLRKRFSSAISAWNNNLLPRCEITKEATRYVGEQVYCRVRVAVFRVTTVGFRVRTG